MRRVPLRSLVRSFSRKALGLAMLDEEPSESSTFLTGESHSKGKTSRKSCFLRSAPGIIRRNCKRVQFHHSVDIHFDSETDLVDRAELFISRQNVSEFKRVTQAKMRQIENASVTDKVCYSYRELMERLYNACTSNETKGSAIQITIRRYMGKLKTQEAIECFGISMAGARRDHRIRREEMIDRINEIQDDIFAADNKHESGEKIRRICEDLSLPSRRFAFHVAKLHAGKC